MRLISWLLSVFKLSAAFRAMCISSSGAFFNKYSLYISAILKSSSTIRIFNIIFSFLDYRNFNRKYSLTVPGFDVYIPFEKLNICSNVIKSVASVDTAVLSRITLFKDILFIIYTAAVILNYNFHPSVKITNIEIDFRFILIEYCFNGIINEITDNSNQSVNFMFIENGNHLALIIDFEINLFFSGFIHFGNQHSFYSVFFDNNQFFFI